MSNSKDLTAGSYPTRETPERGRPSNSLHFVVGEMSGKLDHLVTALMPQIEALKVADQGLDSRVSSLEMSRGRMLGGSSVVVFLVTSWEVVRYVLHR